MELPKPRSLLGWGVIAAVTAVVKEKYTDLTWGDVARAPVQGVLDAYNDSATSGWRKVWNVGIEAVKIAAGVGVVVAATALAPAALTATAVGTGAVVVGGLVGGALASHFVIDPLLDTLKVAPHRDDTANRRRPGEPPSDTVATQRYASMVDEASARVPLHDELHARPEDQTVVASDLRTVAAANRATQGPQAPTG